MCLCGGRGGRGVKLCEHLKVNIIDRNVKLNFPFGIVINFDVPLKKEKHFQLSSKDEKIFAIFY